MPPKGTGALPFGPCANLNCSNNLCHPIQCYCKGTDRNLIVHSFLDPRCTRNSKFGKLRVDGPPGSGCRPRVIDMTQRQLDYGRQLARNAGQDGSDGRKDTGSKTGRWQKVPNKGMRRLMGITLMPSDLQPSTALLCALNCHHPPLQILGATHPVLDRFSADLNLHAASIRHGIACRQTQVWARQTYRS